MSPSSSSAATPWRLTYEPPDAAVMHKFLEAARQAEDTILFPIFLFMAETGQSVEEVLNLSQQELDDFMSNSPRPLSSALKNAITRWLTADRQKWITKKKEQKIFFTKNAQKAFPVQRAYLQCALNETLRDASVNPFFLTDFPKFHANQIAAAPHQRR